MSKSIGQRIKSRRIELGISQNELSLMCKHKSRMTISNYELSKRKCSVEDLERIAKNLKCNPSWLAGWSKDKEVI